MPMKNTLKDRTHTRLHYLFITIIICALFFTWNLSAATYPSVYITSSIKQPQKASLPRIAVPATPVVLSPLTLPTPTPSIPQLVPGDWSSYVMGQGGLNSNETLLTADTAAQLRHFWTYHAQGGISTQPILADGRIYWGSWDGFEHATNLNGEEVWKTNLGATTDADCDPPSLGIGSTAAVAPFTIRGKTTMVLFVGGGNANFYALNAANGKEIWHIPLGTSPDYFIWSSPIVYKGSVYIGVSSFGDCPGAQGQLVQMDAITGNVQNVFDVVPNGCRGGSIWGSPTIDRSSGELYIATGNADSCWTTEIYAIALIELHATNLAVVGSWQVPAEEQIYDGDFGSTPTLFTASYGGAVHPMVGVVNKSGIYYAFARGAVSDGPVWSDQVGYATGTCDECDSGSIAPSAWDGQALYVAGNNTTVGKTYCVSTVLALDPASGNYRWEWCTGYRIYAAITTIPGLVIVDAGPFITILNAKNGKILFSYKDTTKNALFYGPASVAHGVLYAGDMNGNLIALGFDQPSLLRVK